MRNQSTWVDAVFAANQELWGGVALLFGIMRKSGVVLSNERRRDLGFDFKAQEDPLTDAETIAVYVADLAAVGVTAHDLGTYQHEVRRQFTYFPTASEMARAFARVKYEKENPGVIESPVFVYLDGVVRMTSRQAAERQGLTGFDYQIECEVAHGLREPLPLPAPGKRDPRTLVERLTGGMLRKKPGPA